MCKQNNETISHIVSGCPKLAQKEYKKRHDNVARAVHCNLSEKYGFERSERWCDHVPDGVLEKEDEKVEKYQDLAREVRNMWGVRTKVIPIVVGVGNNTTEVKRKSEDHKCRHIH